jgi:hypothetical protein
VRSIAPLLFVLYLLAQVVEVYHFQLLLSQLEHPEFLTISSGLPPRQRVLGSFYHGCRTPHETGFVLGFVVVVEETGEGSFEHFDGAVVLVATRELVHAESVVDRGDVVNVAVVEPLVIHLLSLIKNALARGLFAEVHHKFGIALGTRK